MKQLFTGGPILTMEGPARPEALLVEDGRIRELGSLEKLRADVGDSEIVNLNGRALLPAFVDPHSHFSQVALSTLQVSLEGCRTLEEITARVRDFIRRQNVAPGAWVQARSYDQNLLPDRRHPPLAALDACAPENPLVLQHVSGHMGVFNTLALRYLQVTPETPSPAGGRIGQENGVLTGYMEENAFVAYLQRLPLPDPAALMRGIVLAQREYASHGIATVQEGLMLGLMVPLYQALLQQELLYLDVVGYPTPEAYGQARAAFPKGPGAYDRHFRLGGLKVMLDGSPQARTAWLRRPYEGSEECCYGRMSDEELLAALELAARERLQILAHCNGDAACEQYLRCIEETERKHPDFRAVRPVLVHGQLLGLDQLQRVKALGVVPSFFVAHVWHWGDTHLRNFGPDRAAHISPAGSALELGIPFTFHQDSPVLRPDMLETLWCAVNRQTRDGVLLGEKERISPQEALRAVTANAAWQYFEEGSKGTLRPGKRADLTVLDRDPLGTPMQELREVRVLATYKDGRIVWQAE